MSNLDNLVAEILQQAQKEANRMLTKAKQRIQNSLKKKIKKYKKKLML